MPFKKAPRPLVTYLEKAEMDAVLATPDLATTQGRRDHALLLFLDNTGARADEAAQARIEDLSLPQVPDRDLASVLIRGKGNKPRRCPLWAQTVRELTVLVRGRAPTEHVFWNRRGQPITRFGIHTLVERSAVRAAAQMASLVAQRSAHTRFVTRPRRTYFAPGWTSTRSEPGWGMCPWRRRTCMRRSIWR